MASPNKTGDSSAELMSALPIVAIGASAGGLEAVTDLLTHLSSTTGLAYAYIQHQAPSLDGQLANLLGQATPMPVLQAQHLMPVRPNHVYVIPPDQNLEVTDGVLMLKQGAGSKGRHLPIDQFFMALAEQQKERVIAVLLSGRTNDGTLGLRAVKAAGGITFAQDSTALFQTMPHSAIADNVVDQILPPPEIAQELARISQQPDFFSLTQDTEDTATDATPQDLRRIIQLLHRSVGVDFAHYKMTTIRRRIVRRMGFLKLETLAQYAKYLRQNPNEIKQLYNDLLIHVTTFFRDEDTMDYLQQVILPRIISTKSAYAPLRIWVAGCSTGQEPYSLAMLILEIMDHRGPDLPIQLFATDLSEGAIARARRGNYTQAEVAEVSPQRLQRFFTKVDDYYHINRSVRDLCVFAPQNLLTDPPFSRLDLISCRNLLIYLDPVLQQRAINLFHYGLNPNGYLLLGKSETVGSLTTLFVQVDKSYKLFSRKNESTSRAVFRMSPPWPHVTAEGEAPPDNKEQRRQPLVQPRADVPQPIDTMHDLEKRLDELLLSHYVPASVVVNENLDILLFRGATGLFLEHPAGRPSLNLLKMARPSLVFELRSAVHKARKEHRPVRKTGLEVALKEKTHPVAIEVVPFSRPEEELLFVVLFEEVPATLPSSQDLAALRSKRIKQLEEEKAALREDMRSIIEEQEASREELQSANEEIISSNEELQSTNEELETSKEEIESTNEELMTINQELQVRNDQLSEANEFAGHIFATIREATLVLDQDLRVRSANKAFYRLFEVDEKQTEGRLIYELGNRQWDIPGLRQLLGQVITQKTQVEDYEVNHHFPNIGVKVLRLNARRIVRQQESILLAIEDITDHWQAQRLLAEREAFLHTVMDKVPALIWVANANGHCTFFNQAWLEYTGQALEEAIRLGWEHAIHPDDREMYLASYGAANSRRQPFQVEFRLKRQDGEYRWMLMNARPTFGPEDAFNGYIGSCAEIYNRKTLLQALGLRLQNRMNQLQDAHERVLRAQRELANLGPDETSYPPTQQELAQTQQELQTLMENTPDVITRWDGNLKLLYANSAFERKTGVANVELTGKTNQEMGQPDEIALPYMAKLQAVFDSGQRQTHYNSFPTPDGLVYFFSSMVPERAPDGSIQSVLAIARDISDLKLVEEIQQTMQNLQVVVNSSPVATGLLKPVRNPQYELVDFQVAVCNQALSRFVGKSMEQLPGRSVGDLAMLLWRERTLPLIRQVLETGQPFYDEHYQVEQNRWLALALVHNDDGVVLTILPITELKKAEQQQLDGLNELEKTGGNPQLLGNLRQKVQQSLALLLRTFVRGK